MSGGSEKEKLAFSSDSTYEDLRALFRDKLVSNKDLLNLPVISLLSPAFPLLPSGTGMPILPLGGQQLPSLIPQALAPIQVAAPV